MSKTYDIICINCRESLWIGQRDYIYTDAAHLDALKNFLFVHRGHELRFLFLDEENSAYLEDRRILVNADPDDLDESTISYEQWLTEKGLPGFKP